MESNSTCHIPPACMLLIFFSVSALFIMQRQGFLDTKPLFYCLGKISARVEIGHSALSFHLFVNRSTINSCQLKATINRLDGVATFVIKECFRQKISKIKSTLDENVEELYGDDDELCPVECVREFKTDEELSRIMENAKESNALVVVDFYRTSCGSCKYIEQGFMKLCKGSGKQDSPVVFLKHNVSYLQSFSSITLYIGTYEFVQHYQGLFIFLF